MNLRQLTDIPPWDWPEDAATLILNTLRDRSVSGKDRLLAANLAGDMVILSEEIAETLLNIIESKDESDELRSSAAISLGPGLEEAEYGDYGDPNDIPAFSESFVRKIQHTLHTLYSDSTVPIDVRRRVLEASVRNPQNWHTDAIRAAWAAKEGGEWKLTAVFCMGFVKGFEAQILEALENADPEIHYHAVEAAGNWELDAAWPHIAQLISSPKTEKWLLIAAIRAAASVASSDSWSLPPLRQSTNSSNAFCWATAASRVICRPARSTLMNLPTGVVAVRVWAAGSMAGREAT